MAECRSIEVEIDGVTETLRCTAQGEHESHSCRVWWPLSEDELQRDEVTNG
jgi:hypothetical protein